MSPLPIQAIIVNSHCARFYLASIDFGNFFKKEAHFSFIQNSLSLLIIAIGLTFAKKIKNH